MSEFLERLAKTVDQRRLLARGQKILVAVSGGVDSMVLLQALHALAQMQHWNLSVAHFNHRLRGGASEADEELVRQTAARLRLPFLGGGADVKQLAARSKISVEMAARKLRHEFLARTAREQGLATIALAHHADDQVELFFLRLLRGAGGEGLAGMKWGSPSPAEPEVSLVRPLLDCTKADLLDYARASRIRFREDASNFSTDFLRNRIRRELLPLLRKKYQPGLNQTVLRLMDIVGADAEVVSDAARDFLGGGTGKRGGASTPLQLATLQELGTSKRRKHRAPVSGFNAPTAICHLPSAICCFDELPLAVQRKVLQQQLAGFGLLPDFELVEQLRLAPGKAVSVCAGLTVMREAAGKVACREQSSSNFNPAERRLKLSGKQGRAEFGGRKLLWRVGLMKRFQLPPKHRAVGPPQPSTLNPQPGGAAEPPALREFFDADKIGAEIILRHWQPGDRFQPIGLPSSVKLQDLFVNAKIPAARRRELVLAVTAAGAIFWVEGLRISEQFKLTPQTRRKLVWQFGKA